MNRVAIFVQACRSLMRKQPSLIGTSDPIIDTKGVDMNQHMIDKRECQAYASTARGAAAGVVVGGAIGAVINREPIHGARSWGWCHKRRCKRCR